MENSGNFVFDEIMTKYGCSVWHAVEVSQDDISCSAGATSAFLNYVSGQSLGMVRHGLLSVCACGNVRSILHICFCFGKTFLRFCLS